jgi:hypothetical protein
MAQLPDPVIVLVTAFLFLIPLAGLVLGIIGIGLSRVRGDRGLAITGLIISSVMLLLPLVVWGGVLSSGL